MGIEFELKFCSDERTNEAIARQVAGEEMVFQMATTYYDTPSGALSKRHYTLRRRQENQRSVCTLKTPAQGLGRREYELEKDTIEEAIPELCKLSGIPDLPLLLLEGVQEVCYARFTRIAKTLVLPECTVELALDHGILGGGHRQIPLCEVEVELKEGSREAAVAYARQLALTYGLEPEKKSKFQRARELASGL